MIPLSATMKRVSRPTRAPSSAKKPYSPKNGRTQRANSTGQIRIIGGQWRGRKLPVLNAEGLRPTTDRNKETLFNWLMPYINNARCLDVFAGSGGLGLEALSRYAAHCDFIELDNQAASQLKSNLSLLKANEVASANIYQGDALQNLKELNSSETSRAPYDVVFVDPPFGKGLVTPALTSLAENNLVQNGSVVYLEHESTLTTPTLPTHWQVIKEKHTSALRYMLIEVS
ncbi:16S rRNA (guanine(966)-N(2))-methyltransferase RsmD [Alteromonas sp. BL110]|uniref:16S rRNA (guanine(966)-N(2))-methyltransferase RsmD n=1 Tax=Alteromonas sp. BL110 TaxID=1714845 RepID=UPI000E507E3F|nr:16S rRNA (guanine(966)-N(2))-methyltransferase RsmD [Alteromonas sp. BL110]AXT40792.1 16S rRNA (guanine(966)-N(2))-methyltransferase RsmD [Alteromonas sp. BL110]RKM84257.1 16S rRNA (guanine(966)-N(2))-methyltransferase RsmD [Alteromonas sp. BL110]